MVDQALLRIHEDHLPAIGPFFYNQTRTGAFATEATNTFRYAPNTTAVAQAVVDEAERMAAVGANDGDRERVLALAYALQDSKDKKSTEISAITAFETKSVPAPQGPRLCRE